MGDRERKKRGEREIIGLSKLKKKNKREREKESDIDVRQRNPSTSVGFLHSFPRDSRQFVDPNHSLSLAHHVHSLLQQYIFTLANPPNLLIYHFPPKTTEDDISVSVLYLSLCGMVQPTIILILSVTSHTASFCLWVLLNGSANHHSDSECNSFFLLLGLGGFLAGKLMLVFNFFLLALLSWSPLRIDL